MRRILFILIVLNSLFFKYTYAQDERNKIDMSLTYKGTTETCKVYNVNYYFSRTPLLQKTDTAIKASGANNDEEYIYLSISVDDLSSGLLKIVADPSARVNGTITMTDNYTNKQLKEIKFYDAELNNFSENLSNYTYSGSGGASSLTIISPRISINGVEFKAKK